MNVIRESLGVTVAKTNRPGVAIALPSTNFERQRAQLLSFSSHPANAACPVHERTLWLAGTTDTCALFNGRNGQTYSFYSIARDNVGHVELAPPGPDATTTVEVLVDVHATITHSPLPGGQELITISYPITPGLNYTVEYQNELNPGGSWQELPGAPHNTGTVNDTNIVSQRFYRVRVNGQ